MQFLIIFWPGLKGSISTVICVDDEIQISLLIVGLWTVYLRWWIASRHIIGKSWSWKNLKYLLVLLRNSMLTLKEQMLVARHSDNLQCSKAVLQRSTICNLHMNIKSKNVWSEIVHVVLNSFSIISCRFARNDELQ